MSTLATPVQQPTLRHSRRPALVIAVMTIAALMDMLDVTVVNVALPTLREKLHASPTELEWLIAGYLLAFGATLIVWGRLGDLLGRRRVFLGAVAVFGLASLGAGLSASIEALILFRLIQGAAAGALVPQVLATFRSGLDHATRVVAFGIYGAVAGLAAAAGVVLGGVLTQYDVLGLGWRAIFFVNVPVAAAVLLCARVIPQSRPDVRRSLDPAPMVLVPLSLAAIVYPLLEGQAHGWPIWGFGILAAGVAGLAVAAFLEQRRSGDREPLLNVRQFRIRAFSAGLGVQLLFSGALQGMSLAFVLWLQVGHHYTPLHTGLTLLAFSGGAILTAPQSGKLAESRGAGVLASGAALLVIGTVMLAIPAWQRSAGVAAWAVFGGLAIAGAGLGLLVVPLVNVVLAAVPVDTAGGASGTFSTAQQVGGALGIAIIGSVFFGHEPGAHLNSAFGAALIGVAAAYAASGALCLLLPRSALSEEQTIDLA
ncbi:MAG TPA: MFS transporter [Frankiaceae bacterium]|nr:MFS transporter [Frankiaceae bacterium]